MIFGKTQLEMKVGVFVFIGLTILIMFILSISGFQTWTSRYKINAIFNFVNGLKIGAPVRFAGFDVGEVKDIKFVFDPIALKEKVKVVCMVRKNVNIPLDSAVWVNTLGLLGEKYIEVMPGKNYDEFLQVNSEIVGKDPLPMHEFGELAVNIADHLDEAITKITSEEGTVGKLLYDDALYKELEALITDVRKHPWKLFWKTKEKPEKK
ncbi:MAG: MlaD family protein [Candidatus Omnitrophota bacterium]